jgi:hypothetical protein
LAKGFAFNGSKQIALATGLNAGSHQIAHGINQDDRSG